MIDQTSGGGDERSSTNNGDRRWKSGCFITSLVVLMAAILTFGLGGFLIVSDPLSEADAVSVLGGADLDRMDEAVQYYKDLDAHYFVLTDTGEVIPDTGRSFVMSRWRDAVDLGVAESSILITHNKVSSTWDEAYGVLEMVKDRYRDSVVVVTDPYHSRRTQMIFRRVFEDSGVTPIIRPVKGHWYKAGTWFLSREGWRVTILEYIKIASVVLDIRVD
jgi:uncharacterized SAM-binding protein YcdF (DUF218 family)